MTWLVERPALRRASRPGRHRPRRRRSRGVPAAWRTERLGRALLALLVMSLLLSFGRTTFGSLTVLLPGSTDIFMRRFMMGAQLAGLYLAGIGGAALGRVRVARRGEGVATSRRMGGRAVPAGRSRGRHRAPWVWPSWRRRGPRSAPSRRSTPRPSAPSAPPTAPRGPTSTASSATWTRTVEGASTPACPRIGAPPSPWAPCRCSSTSRAATSTRWATRCARRR